MNHNVPLPKHQYVHVAGLGVTGSEEWVPAVWFGVSSTPGRALGCHVLLENGAMVADLPIHWLGTEPHSQPLEACQAWDCFGFDVVVSEFPYLNLLEAKLLDARHEPLPGLTGQALFTLDWLSNGWSSHPEQHKLLHVVSCSDGSIRALPTDRLLWNDASFTSGDAVPRILRQTREWSVE